MGNDVATLHPSYQRNLYSWIAVRDAIEGEATVKSLGTRYLPMPAAMLFTEYAEKPPSVMASRTYSRAFTQDPYRVRLDSLYINPNYDPNPAYSAYLSRAQFPELTSFILRGLTGLAFADKPTVALPPRMEYLLEYATPSGMSLVELFLMTVVEVLITGRFTLVLTIDTDGKIRIVPYQAENVINWKVRNAVESKATSASFIVVEELVDDTEKFAHEAKPNYFVLRDLGDTYVVEKYTDNRAEPEVTIPTFMGKALNFIPYVAIGSITNTLSVDPIPLYPIVSTAIQIYMRSADLGNSEFLSCNPTLVMTGVEKEEAPKALGSSVVLTISDSAAQVYYTETDTSALNHVMQHINDLYERAVYFGAQLLDSSKKAAESAETARLKQASTGASLISTVSNVTSGFVSILKMAAEWMGVDKEAVKFEAVTEFMAPALTATEQKAMVESWLSGAISKFTLLDNFRRAGVLTAGSNVEDELQRIKDEIAQGIGPPAPKGTADASDPKKDDTGKPKPPETDDEDDDNAA